MPADPDWAYCETDLILATDGSTCFKTAVTEELPIAVAVMDSLHAGCLANDAFDKRQRHMRPAIHSHRGFNDAPFCKSLQTLHSGPGLLTENQNDRLAALSAYSDPVDVEATLVVYLQMKDAYRHQGWNLLVKQTDLFTGIVA